MLTKQQIEDSSKELKCGICTQCCKWNGDADLAIKLTETETRTFKNAWHRSSDGTWRMNLNRKTGSCIHLTDASGCAIHAIRPQACRDFDCRKIFKEVMEADDSIFIKVLIEGHKRS